MMPGSSWSRSRYWLCHFLHNRHVRLRLSDSKAFPSDAAREQALAIWLQRFADRARRTAPWMVEAALQTHAHDPAFVQCLRLWIKEDQYLAKLADHLSQGVLSSLPESTEQTAASSGNTTSLGTTGRTGVMGLIPPLPGLRHFLGLRFEVSILLLGNVLELASLKALKQSIHKPLLQAGLDQLLADRQQHVAFASEWLTREFADFNFLRRNLRRTRLRLLFILMLGDYLWHHGTTLNQAGLSRWATLQHTWRTFTCMLESMVPYHRDALLARLMSQREHPYDQPARML